MVIVWLVVGVVVGALAAGLAAQRRLRLQGAELVEARGQVAVAQAELGHVREASERERVDHERQSREADERFEALAGRVLATTVERFGSAQGELQRERDARLEVALGPLREALDSYQRRLADYDREHVSALSEVRQRADDLLNVQQQALGETSRLNQLLGRSSERGRWGEVQLANVLTASGLVEKIDFDLQVTTATEEGRRRPDCVVHLPGAEVAIDAKFPFDRFEEALAAEDPAVRETRYREHAQALRLHVRALGDRAYWSSLEASPEFVVCFVPSDAAVATALSVDPELSTTATRARVLLTGPTTLLALLWSVQSVVRQHRTTVNAEEIRAEAEKVYERVRVVAEHLGALGKSLNDATRHFNKLVGSVESRLLPVARSLHGLGVAPAARVLGTTDEVPTLPVGLTPQRWGDLPGHDEDTGALDAEVVEPSADEGDAPQ